MCNQVSKNQIPKLILTLCRITWGLQSVLASARHHNLHLFSSFCLSFWSIYTIEPGRIHGLCQIWSRTLSPENLLLRVSFIIISIPHLDPHLCFEIGLCHSLQLPGCVGRESSTLWSVVQHETLVIIMITMIIMLAIYDTDCNSIRTRNSIESDDILNEVFHLRRLRVNKVGWCTEPGGKILGFEVSQDLLCFAQPWVGKLEVLVQVVQTIQEVSQLSDNVWYWLVYVSDISNG